MKKLISVILLIWAGSVNAIIVDIMNHDQGNYSSTGIHNASDDNYTAAPSLHNFVVYDLSSLSDNVVSATINLWSFQIGQNQTYNIHAVDTNISALTASSTNDVAIYNDLGSGDFYGSIAVLGTEDNTLLQITLNATAIDAINAAAGGFFAIGGFATINNVFGSSSAHASNKLILETSPVPMPATAWFMGTALLSLLGFGRKNKAQAVAA